MPNIPRSALPAVQTITDVDRYWGQLYNTSEFAYFDYYFTGQDVKVSVAGAEAAFPNLPIIQMGYTIQQKKMPVFGFWSHTYDAMLRGNRSVQGQFVVATRTTSYMKEVIGAAANAITTMAVGTDNYLRPLTEDDANIDRYWTKNLDKTIGKTGTNLYSVHPPFNFVIVYGIQNVSVVDTPTTHFLSYNQDNPIMLDTNERLVEYDPSAEEGRIILDACEIVSCEVGFGSDGSVLTETYTFIARDEIRPSA